MTGTTPAGRSRLQHRLLFVFVFIFLGGYGNFFPLWLRERSFSETDIGWLQGVHYACLVVFPLLWGRMADRRGDSIGVLRLLTLACVLAFVPAVLLPPVWPMTAALVVFYAFRVGVIPSTDAATLAHVARTGEDYGRYRMWGSAGFIGGGFVLGLVVDQWSMDAVPWPLTFFLVLTAALIWWMRPADKEPGASAGGVSPWLVLRLPGLRAFFGIHFMCRLSLQGLYLFLPLHLQALGVTAAWIPAYWTVGVISEILLIRAAPRIFRGWSPRTLLALCFLAGTVQYGLTAWTSSPHMLLGIMALHGFSFGIWYVTSISWLGAQVPETMRASAQALFHAVGFGLGGMISSVAAGYLYSAWQGPGLFGIAACGCALTLGAHLLWFPRPSRTPVDSSG